MFELKITPQGWLQFVWEDELVEFLQLGEARVKRAGYVEPCQAPSRAGQWMVELMPASAKYQQRLGPFPSRHVALFREREAVEQRLFGEAVGVPERLYCERSCDGQGRSE